MGTSYRFIVFVDPLLFNLCICTRTGTEQWIVGYYGVKIFSRYDKR